MKELLSDVSNNCIHNDLTRDLDRYIAIEYGLENYLYQYNNELYSIRCIGATRGHVRVDSSNTITEIKIYRDKYKTHEIYNDGVEKEFDKYIGMKLTLK